MVSYLTNSIVDHILQELYATHKTLVNISSICSRCLGRRLKSTLCSDPADISSEALGGDFGGGHGLEAQQTQRLFGHHR